MGEIIMLKKHLFLMKPNNQQTNITAIIDKVMETYDYQIIITKSKEHLMEIIEINKQSNMRIYAVGGDGFIHYLIQNMIHTNLELVVLANGTGNDFIRSLEASNNIKTALENSLKQESQFMDIIKANDTYLINSFCFGIDSETAAYVHRYKKIPLMPSSLQYGYVLLRRLMHYKFYPIKVHNDTFAYQEPILIGAICNGKYYGGGFNICPDALLDDGYFDITLIKGIHRLSVPRHLFLIAIGKLNKSNSVTMTKQKEIIVHSKSEVNMDGEVYPAGEYHLTLIPKGIYIVKG